MLELINNNAGIVNCVDTSVMNCLVDTDSCLDIYLFICRFVNMDNADVTIIALRQNYTLCRLS